MGLGGYPSRVYWASREAVHCAARCFTLSRLWPLGCISSGTDTLGGQGGWVGCRGCRWAQEGVRPTWIRTLSPDRGHSMETEKEM